MITSTSVSVNLLCHTQVGNQSLRVSCHGLWLSKYIEQNKSGKLLRCSIQCGTGPPIYSGLNQVCIQNHSVTSYPWRNGVHQIILPAT